MPAAVRRARLLALVVVALMGVRSAAIVSYGDQLAPGASPRGLVQLAVAYLLVLGGLLLLALVNFPRGQNWSRMMAVVVGLVCVLGGVLAVQQDSPAWFTGLNMLIGAVAAWMLFVLFRADANRWFAADEAPRAR